VIIRIAIALWPLFALLLYWLGDFNTYAEINGREYVVARPAPAVRLACAVGVGMVCSAATGAAQAADRNRLTRFTCLAFAFTAVLYVAADLNWYVCGFGPGGEDWVKIRPGGVERLLECGALGSVAGAAGCFALWAFPARRGPREDQRQAKPGAAPDPAA
jgi:hypothetical protein